MLRHKPLPWALNSAKNPEFSFPQHHSKLTSMQFKSGLLFAAIISFSFSSCSYIKTLRHQEPKAEEKKPIIVSSPVIIGRIASKPADKRFVLVQTYAKSQLETGTILTTRGPQDRAANLRITGEKLGEFAAADLQSGTVEQGDAVYSQPAPKPETILTPSESTSNPPKTPDTLNKPETENVQKNN